MNLCNMWTSRRCAWRGGLVAWEVLLLFPTGAFVAFFVVVFLVSWMLAKRPHVWKPFMFAASYAFYAGWGWVFMFLLLGYTVADWIMGHWLVRAKQRRKLILALGVALNLLPLFVFKYYGWLAFNLSELLGGHTVLPLAQLVIPVGISFTTFRGISYIVDVYRGQAEEASPIDFAVYMSFFPYLAAGPIVRSGELLPQFKLRGQRYKVDVSQALYLIVLGLTKKLVIGDFLARSLVDGVFATPGQYSSLDAVVGIHAYAVQIYCDFSGYTDMALGIALLLGFRLPVNFDRPYIAASLREFWRRWHITLSRWLRDYLYIPMGGSRKSTVATYRNVIVTMVLAGLWHGAGWTFLVWGALHGAAQAVEHYFMARNKKQGIEPSPPSGRRLFLRRLFTLEYVCLAWVFFRADSLGAAGSVIARTFTAWNKAPSFGWLVILATAVGIGFQYLPGRVTERIQTILSLRRPWVQGVVFGVLIFVLVGLLGAEGVTNFIYVGF
jgi:alginate O-acetyltransferase complex protein AlgI